MAFTLVAPCEYREEIRKSRFLALAAPVASAAAAQAFIAAHREAGASHNCWAWRVGSQYRFSDDGEPGGSAGRPILAAIEGQAFDQVAVLVIRWYGGIQLGTGGLARAYGGSAAKCLQGGACTPLLRLQRFTCHLGFAELPLLKARLDEFAAQPEGETYDATGARLTLALPAEQREPLQRLLADLSRGRCQLQALDAPEDNAP
ncbi:YigZ family protein [Pseudomonas cavernae]|uniref:YigZ family protein n=1 Tax=Pseudomonas cavernae TaxID=2320867 RepID=A0A385YZW4_9PSED|nr:YigZ family protein [Pseudomonas cavernae]AYC31517.1 YigZ family protein [Pseudomonas cavernae]